MFKNLKNIFWFNKITWLVVLLLAQMALVLYLLVQQNGQCLGLAAKDPLLQFAASEIDEIQIIGSYQPEADLTPNTALNLQQDKSKQQMLTLRLENGVWLLPEYFHFEAQQAKVYDFIDKLSTMQRGWPVGSSKASAEKYKVQADDFETKIIFYSKGRTLQTILLGNTPRFKRVYGRLANESEIYELPFAIHEASVAQREWINTAYLYQRQEDLARIELPEFTISRDNANDDNFVVDSEQNIDPAKLTTLLHRLTHLNLQEILADHDNQQLNALTPKLSYNLHLKSGDMVEHKIYELQDQPFYVLQRTGDPLLFKIDKHTIDEIGKVTAGTLDAESNEQVAAEQSEADPISDVVTEDGA